MKKRYLWIVRRAHRALRHKKMRRHGWWRSLTKPMLEKRFWQPCRDSVATGLAVGCFFALMPLPLQMIFAGTAAMRMHGNVPIAMATCWATNPVTNLPIWTIQIMLGNWIQDHLHLPMPMILSMEKKFDHIGSVNAGNFFLGSFVSGLLVAMLAFGLVHLFAAIMPHHLPTRKRLERKSPGESSSEAA